MFELTQIKTIIFVLSGLVLLAYLKFGKFHDRKERAYVVSSLVVTIILILAVSLKIHHLLRAVFLIPNTVTYLIILIPFLFHLKVNKFLILRSYYFLLVISLVCFLAALIIDLLTDAKLVQFSVSGIIEEFLRILGAIFWFIYYFNYIIKHNNSYETK